MLPPSNDYILDVIVNPYVSLCDPSGRWMEDASYSMRRFSAAANRTGQVRAHACKVVCIQIDTLCAVAESNWKDVVAVCCGFEVLKKRPEWPTIMARKSHAKSMMLN